MVNKSWYVNGIKYYVIIKCDSDIYVTTWQTNEMFG